MPDKKQSFFFPPFVAFDMHVDWMCFRVHRHAQILDPLYMVTLQDCLVKNIYGETHVTMVGANDR